MKIIIKKIIQLLMCVLFLSMLSINIYADIDGETNIDNGGGDMGAGTGQNFWYEGYDGVRITVVDSITGLAKTTPIDYTNKTIGDSVYHFGKVSKLKYKSEETLSIQNENYNCYKPEQKMPYIVSDGESIFPDIEKIRSYFTDEGVVRKIAEHTGMNFTVLTNGSCKLLVEPIAYFTYNGIYYAMTATEAALYDNEVDGKLFNKMWPLTHMNLPLAMYLEKGDLGLSAWKGSISARATNSDIINYLGVGIVSFKDEPPPELEVDVTDYVYRVDTDVITAVTVSGGEANPDEPVTVVFSILGTDYIIQNVVYPEDSSQLVWVKWHTPMTPQNVNITVNVTGAGIPSAGNIKAKIKSLDENPPPDPTAYDKKPSGFSLVSTPTNPIRSSASWNVWNANWKENWIWHPIWVWHPNVIWVSDWVDVSYQVWVESGYWENYVEIVGGVNVPKTRWIDTSYYETRFRSEDRGSYQDKGRWVDEGKWVDEGEWIFNSTNYSASISATMKITPDEHSPTAYGNNMRSGYGFTQKTTGTVTTSAPTSMYTNCQNAVSYFPEFKYKTYWRLLDKINSGMNAVFEFKKNPYSTYYSKVHFSPVWYPDGNYKCYTYILDLWTPSGMLSAQKTDDITIYGSVFDDWHYAAA